MKKSSIKTMLYCSLNALVTMPVYSSIPLWTFSAPSPSRTVVAASGTATVLYTVTNQSNRPKKLFLKETQGLSASPCQLASKGSQCQLIVTIKGNAIPTNGMDGGPILCDENNLAQCYEPSKANALRIKLSADEASINALPESLTLGNTAPDNTGSFTVTNSSAIPALNIRADVSAANGALSTPSYSSSCQQLISGDAPCIITITANSQLNTTTIPIKGDNTNLVNVSVVTPPTVGDAFDGGAVYRIVDNTAYIISLSNITNEAFWQLSYYSVSTSESNTFSIDTDNTYVALAGADFPAAQVCREYAVGSGANTWFLPANDELPLILENISTLNAKRATSGFRPLSVGGIYWTSTQYDVDFADALIYVSPTNYTFSNNDKLTQQSVRCVRAVTF